jgi:mRNA interferase MazF
MAVGIDEGLKHDSSIHCDALMSLPKSLLTHYVGHWSTSKLHELKDALVAALSLADDKDWPEE